MIHFTHRLNFFHHVNKHDMQISLLPTPWKNFLYENMLPFALFLLLHSFAASTAQFCTSLQQDCMEITVMDDEPLTPGKVLCSCQPTIGKCLPSRKQLHFGPEALWTYTLHFTCWPNDLYFEVTDRGRGVARPDQAIVFKRTGVIFPNGTLVTPEYRMRQGQRLPGGRAVDQDHKPLF